MQKESKRNVYFLQLMKNELKEAIIDQNYVHLLLQIPLWLYNLENRYNLSKGYMHLRHFYSGSKSSENKIYAVCKNTPDTAPCHIFISFFRFVLTWVRDILKSLNPPVVQKGAQTQQNFGHLSPASHYQL